MKVSQETKALNAQIANILQIKGMHIETFAAGRGEHDSYKYVVRIIGHKTGDYSFDYTKGSAHVTDGKKDFGGRVYGQQPIPPMPAEVIGCMISDARCADGNTFEDFCSEFGYDTDSRKALEIYLACQDVVHALRRLFTSEMMDQLSNLLGDY